MSKTFKITGWPPARFVMLNNSVIYPTSPLIPTIRAVLKWSHESRDQETHGAQKPVFAQTDQLTS